MSDYRTCLSCEVELSIDNFSEDEKYPDGYVTWCDSCIEVLIDQEKDGKKKMAAKQKLRYTIPSERKKSQTSHQQQSAEFAARRANARNITSKTCIACEVNKPMDSFNPVPRNSDGREKTCKDCVNRKRRERRAANG